MREIASIKADVSVLEDNVLKAIEIIDEAEKKLKEEQDRISQEKKKEKEEEDKLKAEQNELNTKIAILDDKRKIIIRDIDTLLLDTYNKLLISRDGIAIASVLPDNSCSACNIRLTHQRLNEIKMYTKLVLCDNCVRILYIPEDFSL